MPRLLSTAMLVEKNRLESDHVWTLLFEVVIVGAPGPYRLAAYDQDVVFHGLTYLRTALTVDSIEQPTHAALVNLRVTMQNVDQQLIALLEFYWAPLASPVWEVAIWQVDMAQPDETPFGSADVFSVQSATTDFLSCTFDLVAEGVSLTAIMPKRRFVASNGFLHIPRR